MRYPYGHGCGIKPDDRVCERAVPSYRCKGCAHYVFKVRDIKTGKLVPIEKMVQNSRVKQ